MVPLGHDAVAIVFDFVNPARTGRRLFGSAGQTGFDAPQLALQLTRRGHVQRR
jgi:hypothetical protein